MDIKAFLQSLKGDDYSFETFELLQMRGFKQKGDFLWKHIDENVWCLFHVGKAAGEKEPFIKRIEIIDNYNNVECVKELENENDDENENDNEDTFLNNTPFVTLTKKQSSDLERGYFDAAFTIIDNDFEYGKISLFKFCEVMNAVCVLYPKLHNKITDSLELPKGFWFIPNFIQSYYNDIGKRGSCREGCYEYAMMFKECAANHPESINGFMGRYNIKEAISQAKHFKRRMKRWQLALFDALNEIQQ